MIDIGTAGRAILAVALGLAAWSAATSTLGAKLSSRKLALSGQRALFSVAGLVLAASALLIAAFYTRDFSLQYVAGYSSRSTSAFYTFTAFWAGMEGSLLFWTLLSAVYAGTAVAVQRRRKPELTPVATAVLASILAFFLGVLVFGANPFEANSVIPGDGRGLNPLLQSPFMSIHPFMLYLGMTGFAVPFAFAVASLVTGRLDAGWFTTTRRWTVLAWSFLSIGIVLGAAWAYMELGWGGYWSWDPVENASLLPWLTGTAFLHSVMIQERRQMLKIWNVALILGTYCLSIFGTFLTRSGLLSSVHTFSESPVGKAFLPFLAVLLVAAFGLLGMRYEKLRSRRHLDSMFSREAMFLFNNLLLVTIAFTVLWGTLYPIFVEAFSGQKISVGPPFFNTVVGPMAFALLALTGIGPLVAWRKGSWRKLKRQMLLPLVAGTATMSALAANGTRSAGAMFGLGLTAFVAMATLAEFGRGARAHRSPGPLGTVSGLMRVIAGNRRRYGGYIVHLGVVLICLGISGQAFQQEWSGSMRIGEAFDLGGYRIGYESARTYSTDEKRVNLAEMAILRDGTKIDTLTPQRNFHIAQNQAQSEIGLRTSLSDDLYLVVTQMDSESRITLRAWLNPLVAWIWIGGGFMALGMLVILTGKPPQQPAAPKGQTGGKKRVAVPA